MRSFRVGRLGYLLTAWPALAGALIIAGLIDMKEVESFWVALLGLLLVSLAFVMTGARLRDTGRSGWWALAIVVPVLGVLGAVALAFWPGVPGENRFGPAPRL